MAWHDQCTLPYLDSLRLHIFPEAQLIQLLSVWNPIVSDNRVGQGQDLTSVAGISQGFGIPEAWRQQTMCKETQKTIKIRKFTCRHSHCSFVGTFFQLKYDVV